MKSVLFMIPTLDRGGAENVLVNLVNGMDQSKFKITVQTLFDKDSQKNRLAPGIEYRSFLYHQFHGNSRLMARIPPAILYRLIVGKRYDIVVSYLEGPTTHILSGCPYKDTKTVAWVHVEMNTPRQLSAGFRSMKKAVKAYKSFDKLIFVADSVRKSFEEISNTTFENSAILYNTLNTQEIIDKSKEEIQDSPFHDDCFKIVSVGRIIHAKGYDRLVRIQKRLLDAGINCHVYLLGTGTDRGEIEKNSFENGVSETFSFLGFQKNPYKYVAKADLFVCSSRREGFSTAVSEALVLGVPVVSTDCSGARELLGDDEFGLVTENNENSLFLGIKRLLDDPSLLAYYREKAGERGKTFSTRIAVEAVESMLLE